MSLCVTTRAVFRSRGNVTGIRIVRTIQTRIKLTVRRRPSCRRVAARSSRAQTTTVSTCRGDVTETQIVLMARMKSIVKIRYDPHQILNFVQGLKLGKKITFPSAMLQKILPFRPIFNLSDWQTSAF